MQIVATYIKEGLGNKLFNLASAMRWFLAQPGSPRQRRLVVMVQRSRHEDGLPHGDVRVMFPALARVPWLRFLDKWADFDALVAKATGPPITVQDSIDPTAPVVQLQPTAYFPWGDLAAMRRRFGRPQSLHTPDDMDVRDGLAVHIRWGDKYRINANLQRRGLPPKYVLLSPAWYAATISRHHAGKPVYIFTDSPGMVRTQVLPRLPASVQMQLPELDFTQTFQLMTRFRRMVASDSTLLHAALAFNPHVELLVAVKAHTLVRGQATVIERDEWPESLNPAQVTLPVSYHGRLQL